MEMKTWGAKNTIKANTKIYADNIESNTTAVTFSTLSGGLTTELSILRQFIDVVYFFLPWCSLAFTLIYLDEVNHSNDFYISHVGFFIMINMTYSYIIYSIFYAMFNLITGKGIVIFLMCIFSLIYFGGIYVAFLPIILHGEKLNRGDYKPEDVTLTAYITIWIVYPTLVLIFLGRYLIYYLYFSPFMYMFMYNAPYVINIITNAIGKRTISDFPLSIFINAFYAAYYPFSYYGPSWWVEEYNFQWFMKFMVIQGIIIVLITCQILFGSRFMLPKRFRTKVYDKYVKYIKFNSTEVEKLEQ